MRIIDVWRLDAVLIVSVPQGNGISLVCTLPATKSRLQSDLVGETIINRVVMHDVSGRRELAIPENHISLLTEYSYQVHDSVASSVITPTGDSHIESNLLALPELTCLTASFVFIPRGQSRFRHLR